MKVLLLTSSLVVVLGSTNPRKMARVEPPPPPIDRPFPLNVEQLREDLERILPGSTDELYKWAREEQLIDSIARAANTSVIENPTIFTPFTLMIYQMYAAHTNSPQNWIDSISQSFAVRGITHMAPGNIATFIRGVDAFVRVPAWFFNFVASLYSKGVKKSDIQDALTTFSQANPQAVFTNPVFRGGQRISSLVHIWIEFCISELKQGNASACMYDPHQQEWVLLPSGKLVYFRYMLLQSANPVKNDRLLHSKGPYLKTDSK